MMADIFALLSILNVQITSSSIILQLSRETT